MCRSNWWPTQLSAEKIELAIELAAAGLPRFGFAAPAAWPFAASIPMPAKAANLATRKSRSSRRWSKRCDGKGLDVVGPLPADTLFYYAYRGDYDAVVAMYHDQGLGPLKMVAFENGVNWTLGLPFIRTSPDHGTAYDIAGQGKANPSSMRAAIRLAKQLARRARQLHPS